MPSYAAFLGHHPRISLAELSASIPDFKMVRMVGRSIAVFESDEEIKHKDIDKWGGVFLIARQVSANAGLEKVPTILADEVSNVKGKVTFALRTFGVPHKSVHRMYRDTKKILKQRGSPSRYVGNEYEPAASALLHDSEIVNGKHGCELTVLADEETTFVWIGRTIAVQDPDSYTRRDMEKPVRDTRVGLLPPKLAQILLNLGAWIVHETNPKAKKTMTVFDPFCGTGVIPMESLLRGWPVLASDSSLKAVNGCTKNLDWIRKEHGILKRDVPSQVWKQDATKAFDLKEPPHVIVTETTLGPGLTDKPNAKEAAKLKTQCEAIEIGFLQNVRKTLPGVPVVLTFPMWHVSSGQLFLEKTWKQLAEIGFEAVLPPGITPDIPGRTSLLYRRPDQTVGREIVILKQLP